jgi:hypothetical protein
VPVDNNASERALRVVALGRKNFLFVGDEENGANLAGLYSLVATCDAVGVDPVEYLKDVIMRVACYKSRMAKAAATIYQLKVTINDIKPAIWRRLQVKSDIKLGKLHLVLQNALGWTNSHLHQFEIAGERYGMKDDDDDDDDLLDENRYKLSQVAEEKQRFIYEYDFGDSWHHTIVVEKVLPVSPVVRYPICTAGARNCPPEDCGGTWGYEEFLAAIADKKHERHEELLDWIGGPFDPEHFDVDETNRLIHSTRGRRLYEWVRA